MAVPAALIKRLETLENRVDESKELKVFFYYAEENPPFWKPEDPISWQQSHPKGHAVLLEVRNCGVNRIKRLHVMGCIFTSQNVSPNSVNSTNDENWDFSKAKGEFWRIQK